MSDLASRRARVLGTDKVGDDRTVVKAEVPQTELVRYAIDLRASTHGAGTFTRAFAHYEPMPEDVAAKVTPRERRVTCSRRRGPDRGRRVGGARLAQELLEDRAGGSRARVAPSTKTATARSPWAAIIQAWVAARRRRR